MLAIHAAQAARVPKVTQKANHKEYRLSGADGIKDLSIFKASVEAREKQDFSKDGQAVAAESEGSFADIKAKAQRYGLELGTNHDGLGLN